MGLKAVMTLSTGGNLIQQKTNKHSPVFCNPPGFTLIEVILVVVLLAVVVSLSVPQFSKSFQKLQLRQLTQDLAYCMQYAQSRAITQNKEVRLEFDPEFLKYWLTQQASSLTPPSAATIYENISGRMGRVFSVPANVEIKTDDTAISFYPDGSIEKQIIEICYKQKCSLITTQEKRGSIEVYESESD